MSCWADGQYVKSQHSALGDDENSAWDRCLREQEVVEEEADVPAGCRLVTLDDQGEWISCAMTGALNGADLR